MNFKGMQGPEQGRAAIHCIASPAWRKLPDRAHSQNPATDHKAAKWAGHRFMLKICGMPSFAWRN